MVRGHWAASSPPALSMAVPKRQNWDSEAVLGEAAAASGHSVATYVNPYRPARPHRCGEEVKSKFTKSKKGGWGVPLGHHGSDANRAKFERANGVRCRLSAKRCQSQARRPERCDGCQLRASAAQEPP